MPNARKKKAAKMEDFKVNYYKTKKINEKKVVLTSLYFIRLK